MRFALCLWTAAMIATAGPLTIQTQEVIWTNGLDTLLLGPVTVDGPSGGIVLGTYELTVTSPASRFVEFTFTQDAAIGDSRLPFSMRYGGVY